MKDKFIFTLKKNDLKYFYKQAFLMGGTEKVLHQGRRLTLIMSSYNFKIRLND